jgi:hypothetical protein
MNKLLSKVKNLVEPVIILAGYSVIALLALIGFIVVVHALAVSTM